MLFKNVVQFELEKRMEDPTHVEFSDDDLLTQSFQETDMELRQFSRASVGGSCSCSLVLVPKKEEKEGKVEESVELVILNVGDSTCSVNVKGEIKQLTTNHTLENEKEVERIKAAGGEITGSKINKLVNMTRTFGNYQLKRDRKKKYKDQILIALPEISRFSIPLKEDGEELDFVLLACDGVTETVELKKIVSLAQELITAQLKGEYLDKKYSLLKEIVEENVENFNLGEANLLKSCRAEFLSLLDYTNTGLNLGLVCNDIINYSIMKQSLDNHSLIIVLVNRPKVEKKEVHAENLQILEAKIKKELLEIEKLIEKSKKYFEEENEEVEKKEVTKAEEGEKVDGPGEEKKKEEDGIPELTLTKEKEKECILM